MRMILCVPAEHAEDCLNPKYHTWVERARAETDERYRQIIPYILVGNHENEVLTYRRKGNEDRLHGLLSIGIGGHIDHPETFLAAAFREIREEIGVVVRDDLRIRGKIILSNTPVDRVHVGVVSHIKVHNDDVQFSDEILDPQWMTLAELNEHYDELEEWSKHIVDNINGLAN